MTVRILDGMGLTLPQFWQNYRRVYFTEEDIAAIMKAGAVPVKGGE
jgi:hypothetical protein